MNPKNPYEHRWRWWYDGIADWMVRNPGGQLQDCARALGKAQSTISCIVNTDLFRAHLAQRKKDWRERHDSSILEKTTKLAELGLDVLLEGLEKKRDSVPIQLVNEVTTSALERLGYGSKSAPLVQVNNNVDNSQKVVVVGASALAEARMTIRQVEEMKRRGHGLPDNTPRQIEAQTVERQNEEERNEDVPSPRN